MKLKALSILLFLSISSAMAISGDWPLNRYQSCFKAAYNQYPDIPKGILEAVSFSQSRFNNLTEKNQNSCIGIPKSIGVMGLCFNGKNYFRESGKLVEELSGISNLKYSKPEIQIKAYAKAFSSTLKKLNLNGNQIEDIGPVLIYLSELPTTPTLQDNFALNSQLYQLFWLLNNPFFQANYHTPHYNINIEKIFGQENYRVLSSSRITIDHEQIYNINGDRYNLLTNAFSPDYPQAIWNAAASCNYSSRAGTAISAVTIHDIEGSYAGCISWFKNCNASVSAHYVLRSSDGQVTQMVLEADKAWHVGNANPYAIGLEHEGYRDQDGWYTNAMYTSSANLVKDICNSGYGISPLRTYHGPACNDICTLGNCVKIKGHQHFANQTHNDPGPRWNWYLYYNLINNNTPTTNFTSLNGTLYDSGGQNGDYTNDERKLYLISPTNASSLSITFTSFNLETNWDYLYIYDGSTTTSPLIGRYTGTSGPGTITASSGKLLLDFRSDCATTAGGWTANWNATTPVTPPPSDNIKPITSVSTSNNWHSSSFSANFTDSDSGGSGLDKSFYQVLEYNGNEYRANNNNGFYSDNFDSILHPEWTIKNGNWLNENGYLRQKDTLLSNTNIYSFLNQNLSNRYLYNWAQKFGGVNYNGANRRAGFHFMADSPDSSNRGNSYFVWFRLDQDKIQIYKVVNNTWGSAPVLDTSFVFNPSYWYDIKLVYDRIMGKIWIYVDNQLAAIHVDQNPHQTGNYISFRTGNSDFLINNLKIYRSRFSNQSTTVKVGNANTNDIRYQNINPSIPAGIIKSINMDFAGNLSSISSVDVDVDWTPPIPPTVINDGDYFDKDSTIINTILSGNWNTASDPHSGFKKFWFSFGTSAGDSNIVNWTDNWIYDTVYVDSLNLNLNQLYFLNIKAENNAGLKSGIVSSDGILITSPLLLKEILNESLSIYPTVLNNSFTISNLTGDNLKARMFDNTGKLIYSNEKIPNGLSNIKLPEHLSRGNYHVTLFNEKGIQKNIKIILQ
jgi:N-acetyl-anhydromuramyl-L-alanine amidase AmpD